MQNQSNLGQVTTLQFPPDYRIHYYKNPVILNKQYTYDIVPGQYEGGFQLWDCQLQLLKKLFQSEQFKGLFLDKAVCEIGCGHGLLGIGAAILGAKQIILQDYNANVIEQLTKPTVAINFIHCPVNYLSGDWCELKQQEQQTKYDIILGSELIYRQQNYDKVINYIKNNMKKKGKCIMANKSYYFGVGGSVSGFIQKVTEQGGLQCRSLLKMAGKSGGNKKEIIQIVFK